LKSLVFYFDDREWEQLMEVKKKLNCTWKELFIKGVIALGREQQNK